MNWSRIAVAGIGICFGAACGTTRTERTSTQVTSPHTQALSPVKGEAAGAPVSSGKVTTTNTPSAGRQFQKWNPIWWFGNVDDPVPPDWYRPGSPNRRWLWQLRNPLHNFTFYVIGIADKPFTRTGRFPNAVFAPEGGWNWAVARHQCVRLPFLSYHGERWRFYLGWRERGNFGGKVNFGRLKTTDYRPETSDLDPARTKEWRDNVARHSQVEF